MLPHTQQEIADAVGVNPTDKCLRLSGNLDTCPKNQKLAALFEEAMVLPDLDKCPKSVKIAALFEEAINAAGNVIGNVTVNVSCVYRPIACRPYRAYVQVADRPKKGQCTRDRRG